MVLPGLGQAYNRKYWKIPIVYAGFGTMYYFIHTNGQQYRSFKSAYDYKASGSSGTKPNDLVDRYSTDQLKIGREYYRRNLELSYILTGAWYILTIIDADVDAHFFDYNISDDLSIQLAPYSSTGSFTASNGISLRLKF